MMAADPQPHLTRQQRDILRDARKQALRKERRQQHERDAYRATHDEREDEE